MNCKSEGTVTVNRNDKTYTARYRVEKGLISVSTVNGNKTTQLGSSPPETIARLLLGEMINEGSD